MPDAAIFDGLVSSAISTSIAKAGAKSADEALPYEILHNLQYQHNWTDLQLHKIQSQQVPRMIDTTTDSPFSSRAVHLISGLPLRHSYIHPDFLTHLITNNLEESDVQIQREWVLPMSVGEKWSLKRLCHVFDHLPSRDPVEGAAGFKHHDTKRILCAMKARDGTGGDGTIVYYIMQEGEVKPRQN